MLEGRTNWERKREKISLTKAACLLSGSNLTSPNYGGNTLGPLQLLASQLYQSFSNMSWGGGVGYIINNQGVLANIYTVAGTDSFTDCNLTFEDPMDDIINNIREIAFRMSAQEGADRAASNSTSFAQTVAYTGDTTRVIYAVNTQNLILGVIISLAGPLAVLPLFWGWWNLGRTFSMSPLEIANAFHSSGSAAPGRVATEMTASDILASCYGNANGRDVAAYFRRRNGGSDSDPIVRYGVVDIGGAERLCFGVEVQPQQKQQAVRRPGVGEVF